MNARVRGWRDEFDVESSNQFRGTIADQGLDVTEDIREIVVSGIPVYKTSDFETVENLLLEEGATDE